MGQRKPKHDSEYRGSERLEDPRRQERLPGANLDLYCETYTSLAHMVSVAPAEVAEVAGVDIGGHTFGLRCIPMDMVRQATTIHDASPENSHLSPNRSMPMVLGS